MITPWCCVTVRWEHWIQLIKLTKFSSKTELWHNSQLACLRLGSLPLFRFQTSVHFKLHEISFPVCLEMPMGKYLGWAEVQEKNTCWSGNENSSTELFKRHWLFKQIIYLDEGGFKNIKYNFDFGQGTLKTYMNIKPVLYPFVFYMRIS